MDAKNLPRPVLLLVNGNSRRGRQIFPRAVAALRAAGVPLGETVLSRDRDESVRLLKREVEGGAATVIIGGGDGTLSHCAGVLAGTGVAMVVLPLGTGNTFARSIGLPIDLEAAVANVASGRVTSIDVGKVNGRVFLNSVALGFSSSIASALTKEIKSRLGILAWTYMGARVLLTHRPIRVKLLFDGQKVKLRTHQLVIANGRYVAGPLLAQEDASVQSCHFTVFSLGDASKPSMLRAVVQWLTHRHRPHGEAQFYETAKLRVESRGRPLRASVDGDVNELTPLELEVWPRALCVVVPQDFVAAEA